MNVNSAFAPDADHMAADIPLTDWQQEAQRLRCILAQLIRACHEVEETVPPPMRLRLTRALVEAEERR